MINDWKINLSVQRQIRDHYLAEGNLDVANSIDHTESKYEGKTISLLTKSELTSLQNTSPDTILIDIFGEEVLAKDCDDETRYGYVAAGFLKENQ